MGDVGTVVAVLACVLALAVNVASVAYFAGRVNTELRQSKEDIKILRASLHDLRNALLAFMLGMPELPKDSNGTTLTQLVTEHLLRKQGAAKQFAAAVSSTKG